MKTTLKILTSTSLLTGAVTPLTNLTSHSKTENMIENIIEHNNVNQNDKHRSILIEPTSFYFYETGGSTGDIHSGKEYNHNKDISLINFKQYANNWEEFSNKYSKLRLLNFATWMQISKVQANKTVFSNYSYQIDTKNIKFNTKQYILEPKSFAVSGFVAFKQKAEMSFTFVEEDGYLKIKFHGYTFTRNAFHDVLLSLQFYGVIFE